MMYAYGAQTTTGVDFIPGSPFAQQVNNFDPGGEGMESPEDLQIYVEGEKLILHLIHNITC